jgi:hypothetical protein
MTAPDRIQITHQPRTMTTPDFRALCAELLQAWQFGDDIAGPMSRADTALKAEPEGEGLNAADLLPVEPPKISTTMAMQYCSAWREGVEDGWSEARAVLARRGPPSAAAPAPGENLATQPAPNADPSHIDQLAAIIRTVDGSNSMGAAALAEAILERYPLAFLVDPSAAAPAPGENLAAQPAPEPGEVAELVEFLTPTREQAGAMSLDAFLKLRRAATLLQRLAPPACLVVDRLPEGFSDLLKSEPGRIEACTAGVSIEPLGDAARPTFQDAISLAEGCHDYSGGHSGTEGEAWHGAIDTVVAVLKRAAVGPWDSQTRAVFGVGSEAQAGEVAVPVAVSERLPGAEDCDEDGFCWMGYGYKLPGVDEKDSYAMWMLMPSEESSGEVWLPAHAIPLPQAGEVE